MNQHAIEIEQGKRFEFGANWVQFLDVLNDERIALAEQSLCNMLGVSDLTGKNFLDIGSGSGLFSLVARRLGATVHSFDYDPQSVACTAELKRRYCPADPAWIVEQGSALDRNYLQTLGQWDIVYSWGVLHHTGKMWIALENLVNNVAQDGKLFIAIYNDQGRASKIWWRTKKAYLSLPKLFRWLIMIPCFIRLWGPTTIRDLMLLKPFNTWITYKKERGMSPFRDVVDWVGGFPFEVATPEQIFDFYRERDFQMLRMKTCAGGHGCNEFVFQRNNGF